VLLTPSLISDLSEQLMTQADFHDKHSGRQSKWGQTFEPAVSWGQLAVNARQTFVKQFSHIPCTQAHNLSTPQLPHL